MPVDEYAQNKLFAPLGISNFTWVRHRGGQVWGASGLRLNARDFAKIGQLYLQNGQWLGQSVLPDGWVSSTFQPRIDTLFPMKIEYGLNRWLPAYEQGGNSLQTAMAQGNGGQSLILFPDHDLMVVTLAGYYNDVAKMIMLPPRLTREYILPAMGIPDVHQVRSKRPVPYN